MSNNKFKLKWPYAPYPKQRQAMFGPHRFGYIEGSTKSGKSSFARVWLIKETLQHKGQSCFITRKHENAKNMFNEMCFLLEQLPKGMVTFNKSSLLVSFTQGGTIQFFTSESPDALYGYKFKSVIIDEASRVDEGAYHALLSTMSTYNDSKFRAIGNVQGRSNWFFKECRKAEQGLMTDAAYYKLTAQDVINAGIKDESYLQPFRERYSPALFNELFYCIPSGNNASPFGSDNIRAILGKMSTEPVFCYGIDVAQTKDGGDATAIVGLDKEGKVCFFEHVRLNGPEVIELILKRIPSSKLMYLDGTAIGKMVYDSLVGQKPTNNWTRYNFTNNSKQVLMETLAAGIIGKEITVPEDSIIAQELDSYEYEFVRGKITFNAPAGLHDDAVVALALAYKCYIDNFSKTITVRPTYHSEIDLGVNGLEW